jgi:hypothetical protein
LRNREENCTSVVASGPRGDGKDKPGRNLRSHISVSSIQFSYRGKPPQETYGNDTHTSAVRY